MDEPWKQARKPPGPAFEKAQREDEHKRQQRIAKLTADQRREFEQLRQGQQGREKDLATAQRQRWRSQMASHMRTALLQDKAPHLRPDSHRRQLTDSQDLRHAINDYIDGRNSRVASAYRSELGRAYHAARNTVVREQGHERDNLRKAHMAERDGFLTRAERERSDKTREQFRENARDITSRQSAPAFNRAARDPIWQRAFNRAAKQEARREKDRDHDKTR